MTLYFDLLHWTNHRSIDLQMKYVLQALLAKCCTTTPARRSYRKYLHNLRVNRIGLTGHHQKLRARPWQCMALYPITLFLKADSTMSVRKPWRFFSSLVYGGRSTVTKVTEFALFSTLADAKHWHCINPRNNIKVRIKERITTHVRLSKLK